MGLFRRGVTPDQVLEKGRPGPGRIVGIDVDETSSGESSERRVDTYAVEVYADPPFVAGVEQTLRPDRIVRLGMDVQVRHLDSHVIIDWQATCGGGIDWVRLVKTPPARTITDATLKLDKARKRGLPGTVTITSASIVDAMLGLRQALRLDVVVRPDGAEPYDSTIDGVDVPHYASHLVEVGTVLPALIDARRLDRVTIDWPTAAVATPGVGQPASPVLARIGNVFTGTEGDRARVATIADQQPVASGPSDVPDAIDGVSFSTWVAVEVGVGIDRVAPSDVDDYAQRHGAPPGAYATAAEQWMARARTDWRLGAAFGEACEAERKRRR